MRKNLYRLLSSVSLVLGTSLLGALTSDEALKTLLEGNQRYMSDQLLHADNNANRRASLVSKQEPFAIILGCSDSRVAPEIIFDQNIGDLFVVRVAGNVVGPIELDSIEYSALYLGSRLIIVLGHENCGAVQAVLTGNTQDIEAIAVKIEPALVGIQPQQKNALERAIVANVRLVVDQLSNSPVLGKMLKTQQLKIVGGYYDLLTGQVRLLNPPAPATAP